jgi:Ras-related GTP-binding protein C/D
MVTYASHLHRHNQNIKFEIFLHKVENMNDDDTSKVYEDVQSHIEQLKADESDLLDLVFSIHFTSCMDQTIFDATSKVIQKLIPEQAQLENLLNVMIKLVQFGKN